ncbi:unnamed protein product [Dicrocoelium dendriticum]|nr:unnamed protein product [Dicrocoelium dendriticum]
MTFSSKLCHITLILSKSLKAVAYFEAFLRKVISCSSGMVFAYSSTLLSGCNCGNFLPLDFVSTPCGSKDCVYVDPSGFICLSFFDHDINHDGNAHPEGTHKSLFIHKAYELFSNIGLSDHKIGVVVLLLAVCLDAGFTALSRNLVSSIGGAKRFQALSSMLSVCLLVPIFLLVKLCRSWWLSTQTSPVLIDPDDFGSLSEHSNTNHLISLFLVVCIGVAFVVDFYFTALISNRIGPHRVAHLSKVSIVSLAILFCLFWPTGLSFTALLSTTQSDSPQTPTPSHSLSAGALFATASILYASNLLHSPKVGQGPDGSSSGHFIGYSMAGLPLFALGQTQMHTVGISNQSESFSFWYHVRSTLRSIMSERSSRRIFAFLCLNLAFTFVELLYGVWTNSLGLISDGFHMLFDSAALVIGLYAAVVSRWKPTRLFSYGFHSAEVLSGFVNALFLLIISGSVFVNALARIHRPPNIQTDRLMAVSVAGLLVNLVGVLALGHAHSHGCSANHGHSHSNPTACENHIHSHESSFRKLKHPPTLNHTKRFDQNRHNYPRRSNDGGDANLRGVYLHVLADTLGSIGVIFSSYLVTTYGWNIADPICSMFLAGAIGYSAAPLLHDTLRILTLRAPALDQPTNPEWIVHKVLSIDGVLAVYNPFVWSQALHATCVSLCVRVDQDTCEQLILAQIQDVISAHCNDVHHLTIQVEKEVVQHALQALGVKPTILLHFARFEHPNHQVYFLASPTDNSELGRRLVASETITVLPI